MDTKESTGNKPEKKFSTGAISATVWKNAGKNKKGEDVLFRTISIQRRYQDKEGNWQTTNSMRINDLPKASLVLNKAYEYCILRDPDNNQDLPESEEIEVEEI